jgi:DNA-binding MarR family transcriptional regulator
MRLLMKTDIAERVAQGLSKIGLVMKQNAWRQSTPRGINPAQAQVLVTLHQHPNEALGTGDIAGRLAITAASASDSIKALVEKGLIEKRPSPLDARAVVLRLTGKGKAEAARCMVWPDFLLAAVDSLSAGEQDVFVRSLVKMIRSLQTTGSIPVSRMCVSCSYFRPHAHAGTNQPHHCDFVDAPFGDSSLRFDCPEQRQVDSEAAEPLWTLFVNGKPLEVLAAHKEAAAMRP